MIVKRPQIFAGPIRRIVGGLSKRRWATLIAVAAIIVFTGYSLALVTVAQRIDIAGITRLVKKNAIYVPTNYVRSLFTSPDRISIDIKHKYMLKLEAKREAALRRGYLLRGEDDYIPAEIRHGDRRVKVRLRLKGELPDHYRGKKWSMRVVAKNGDTLFGMKRMSLQSPRTRYYLYEWVFQKMIAREGLVALRYDFIDVTINGKPMGIYALEEHFEDRLIEHNRRPPGPIVFYSDAPDSPRYNLLSSDPRWRADMQAGAVDVYRKSRTFSDPVRKRQFEIAKNRLEAFRRDQMKTCDVFDCARLGRWLALLDLTSARHNARHGNLKFYFNPETEKMEPIAYDGSAVGVGEPEGGVPANLDSQVIMLEDWYVNRMNEPFYRFLQDDRLFRIYMNELGRVSQSKFLDDVFADLSPDLSEKLPLVHRDYPHFRFDKSFFYKRQNRIRKYLNPPTGLIGYLNGQLEKIGLRRLDVGIANIVFYPLQVTALKVNGVIYQTATGAPVVLAPFVPLSPMRIQDVTFTVPESATWPPARPSDVQIGYRSWDGGVTHWTPALRWSHTTGLISGNIHGNLEDDLQSNKRSALSQAAYIDVDKSAKSITFRAGDWEQSRDIILPEGYIVSFEQGTRIALLNGARLVSHSPVMSGGTETHPVIIDGGQSPGAAFHVVSSAGRSRLEHTRLLNLGGRRPGETVLVSGVVFYRSPVEISASMVSGAMGPAALRITGGKFAINDTVVTKSAFNGLEIYFGDGNLVRTAVEHTGVDAAVFSGSRATLNDITIRRTLKTAIRVVDGSHLIANGVEIQESGIAISAMNMAKFAAARVTVKKAGTAFSVGQDGESFGPSTLSISSGRLMDVDAPFLLQEGSVLLWNGHAIPSGNLSARNAPRPFVSSGNGTVH